MQTYLFFKRIAIKLYIIYLVVDNKIYERDSKNIKVTFSVILSNFFAPISQILEVLNLLSWRYHWLLRKRIFEHCCKENLVVFTAALIILFSFQSLNNMRYMFFVEECVKGIGKTWQNYPFSRAVSPPAGRFEERPTNLPTNPPWRSRACLVPRRLSLDENVRAKEGGKETTGEWRLYPSHGHLRFITSHSRFALASSKRSAWGGGWFCLECWYVRKYFLRAWPATQPKNT